MPLKSPRKLIGQLTQREYARLRALTDGQNLDQASLERTILEVVNQRFEVAKGFVRAAKFLDRSDDPLVQRTAVSRAYYGAYHAARATVFAVRHRDEDDHDKLSQALDSVVEGQGLGAPLKELRRLRNEMDYSPYPGPDLEAEYEVQEIADLVKSAIASAEGLIQKMESFLQGRP